MAERPARYLELATILEDRWADLGPGSLVESENQLAAEFGVNRLTAREAVRELERRLIVRRIVGVGTFTAHRVGYQIRLGEAPSFRRIVLASGHAPGIRPVSHRWTGRGRRRTFEVTRVRTIDGLVASVGIDRFPRPLADVVAAEVTGDASVFDVLQTAGVSPRRDAVSVALVVPDGEIASLLEYPASAPPCWRLSSTTIDGPTGEVVHHSEAWMRPDMFEVTVELGRDPSAVHPAVDSAR
jgi:DNA-binding GntR family transcriptional regulator